jgi:hypothetical protein
MFRVPHAIVLLLLSLVAVPSLAQQEYRGTVTLNVTDTNLAFTMSVANTSTAPQPITSIVMTLNTGLVFDTFGTVTPAVTIVPSVGANNDGSQANSVTITPTSPLMPGQTLSSSAGDIDGGTLSSISVTLNYGTTAITRSLVLAGSTWSASFQQPATPIPTGTLTLTWEAPTENTDGTPYTNPGGFKIYYGTMQGTYANSRTINDPAARNYLLDMLPYATYYVVATAFSTAGAESAYSNVASATVQSKPDVPVLAAGATVVGPEGVAYTIFQSLNNGVLVPIGTVPVGTPCNGNIGFRDESNRVMYAVPKAAVDFEGDADAELLFSLCD